MKRLILAAVLMLAAVSVYAQSGKSIYNRYSDEKGVEAVYISPSMFKMLGRIPDMEIEDSDINLTPIIKSLEGLYILESDNKTVSSKIKADVDKMLQSRTYELIMEAKEDGEVLRIYTYEMDGYIRNFLLTSMEDDEYTVICLDGKMLKEELETIIANSYEK